MTRPTANQWFFGSLSLSGLLLSFAASVVWSKVDAHDEAIPVIQERQDSHTELLQEVRADVKELRDDMKELLGSVHRMEGANDVANQATH